MKSPKASGEEIEKIIRSQVSGFSEGIIKSQQNAFNKIIGLLKEIGIDSDGNIKRTGKNIRNMHTINNELGRNIITDAYKGRVESYLNGFSQIQKVNNSHYALNFPEFSGSKSYYELIRKENITNARALLLEGGISANFSEPIKDILRQNIMGGGKFFDMVGQVRNFILGNDAIDGRLLAYTKQITSDSLHVYSGLYNQAIADDLGLEWVRYTGSVKDTTREFCQQRAGKFFHEEQVKSWPSLKWQGKYRGTNSSNIFQYVGGYQCRHILIYVSEAVVPSSVISNYNSN
jgi:hypothetical protein